MMVYEREWVPTEPSSRHTLQGLSLRFLLHDQTISPPIDPQAGHESDLLLYEWGIRKDQTPWPEPSRLDGGRSISLDKGIARDEQMHYRRRQILTQLYSYYTPRRVVWQMMLCYTILLLPLLQHLLLLLLLLLSTVQWASVGSYSARVIATNLI